MLDGSSVVRLLDALETAHLIERRGENADRRAKTITLTATALSIIDQVEAVSREVRNAALAGLSDDESRSRRGCSTGSAATSANTQEKDG